MGGTPDMLAPIHTYTHGVYKHSIFSTELFNFCILPIYTPT